MVNKLVVNIVISQSIICSILAGLSQMWQVKDNMFDDLMLEPTLAPAEQSTLAFFTYFLLLNTLLPISLQVALEVVKLVQAYFIEVDALMFSWERDRLVKCQTASVVEDLGQIGYIFSDKTGTLTRNVMEFKYMVVGSDFYGNQKKFEAVQHEEGEGEVTSYKKLRESVRRPSYISPDIELNDKWNCANYTTMMEEGGDEVNRNITSVGG